MPNILISSVTILFSTIYLIISYQQPVGFASMSNSIGPMDWPRTLLYVMLTLGIILLFKSIKQLKKGAQASVTESELIEEELLDDESSEVYKERIWIMTIGILIYIVLIGILGFVLATPLIMIFAAWVLGMRKGRSLIMTSVIFSTIIIVIFPMLLKIPMPRGISIFRELSLFFY